MRFSTAITQSISGASIQPYLPGAMWSIAPLCSQLEHPFIPARLERQVPRGAYLPTESPRTAHGTITRPQRRETKAALLGIHSPKPVRAFKTAGFLKSECAPSPSRPVDQANWDSLFEAFHTPAYDSSSSSSLTEPLRDDEPLPVSPTPSPLVLPAWPSQPLSLSIPSLGIYPSTPLDIDNAPQAHRDRLFGYNSLTASRGYQKTRRFDPFGDYDNDESERASTCSDASFYSVASSPGSPTSDEAESPSTFDSDSFAFSSPATSAGEDESLDAGSLALFREAVRLSTVVLALDDKKECMDGAEWKDEMKRVLGLWKGLYAKGVGERLSNDRSIGRRGDAK